MIVMPRAEIDLRAYHDYRGGALPVDEAVPILRDVVAKLTVMEGGGVMHRDIKPSNVLLYRRSG